MIRSRHGGNDLALTFLQAEGSHKVLHWNMQSFIARERLVSDSLQVPRIEFR